MRGTRVHVFVAIHVDISSPIALFHLGSFRATATEVGTGFVVLWVSKAYLGFSFLIPALALVIIECCNVEAGTFCCGDRAVRTELRSVEFEFRLLAVEDTSASLHR